MGADLGTPAAVAAIHNLVREGNKLFAVGASERQRAAPGAVRAMLWVLGWTRWTSTGTQHVCTRGAAVHSARHGPPMCGTELSQSS